jgi:GNAT superfamily N-acetyltransferase
MSGRVRASLSQKAPIPLPEARHIDTEAEVAACYGLMRQLRPHLGSEQELIERWRRQVKAGYRLIAIWKDSKPVALAGYRVQENLVYGLHFYVDDLVTEEAVRSSGYGQRLMDRLKVEALTLGCKKFVLDTALTNFLGHRFYFREGLLATALRFSVQLN